MNNNLTPLQEVALRILTAKIEGKNANPSVNSICYDVLLESSIADAHKFLDAAQPEPLEVTPLEWKPLPSLLQVDYPLEFTKGGEFKVYERHSKFYLINEIRSTPEEEYQVGIFPTLDEAKQFANFIRTR